MPKKSLDFLVIGSQKGGTTSLFEYVRTHPEIYLPPEKEVPYFNIEARVERGWDWYVDWVFARAPVNRTWGLISTFYMDGTDGLMDAAGPGPAPTIQGRIHEAAPDVKLIAILRDPVERAISHHRMSVMKLLEHEQFEQAIPRLLERDTLVEARLRPTETNSYVVRGEYGRILSQFREVFPPSQLLVLFTEDLARDPRGCLRTVFGYVGVDPTYVPPNLERRYREAADRRRVSWLDPSGWRTRLAANEHVKRLWEAVPHGARRAVDRRVRLVSSRLELWNAHRGAPDPTLDPTVLDLLKAHYRSDLMTLEALGYSPPWSRGR